MAIEKKLPNKKWPKVLIILLIISFILAILSPNLLSWVPKKVDVTITDFSKHLKKDWYYSKVLVDWNKVIWTLKTEESEKKEKPKNTFQDLFLEKKISPEKVEVAILPTNDSLKELWFFDKDIKTPIKIKDNSWEKFWSDIFPTILAFVLFFIVAMFLISRMWWMANNAMTFWKSRARLYDKDKDKVTFKDVAWAEEEKQELEEVVDFLKNPKKYHKMWAKIPRWILLVWPPWTWKTLLARAVAWESWVPFLSISWSEFVEMFVWVWASRVRDLFEKAKKIAPAIIFIDEIDAIGKKRWPWTGWGHDEREQTLNQILTEMDWFDNETSVIVMWATNRADVLDKALLRPWRFDRKVTINLPNLKDREKILEVHCRNKKLSSDVDLKTIASMTTWFSWADLWNLINEAAIIAARYNENEISMDRIKEAFERIVMWLRKKSLVMNEQEKKITAYHEVGHALVWKILPNTDPLHKVSIVSRWWALWVTWFLPERDKVLISKAKYLDELATLYGWRVAEEIFFWKENITTWASNDIEKATDIARQMVMRYWMFDEVWKENFAWEIAAWNHLWVEWNWAVISDKTQEQIDKKVKEILDWAYEKAREIISKYKDLHIKIAEDLLKVEEINKKEFDEYFTEYWI